MDKQGFFTAKSVSIALPTPRSGTTRPDAASRRPGLLFEARDGRASDALGRRP
jgi:hypothetical protein